MGRIVIDERGVVEELNGSGATISLDAVFEVRISNGLTITARELDGKLLGTGCTLIWRGEDGRYHAKTRRPGDKYILAKESDIEKLDSLKEQVKALEADVKSYKQRLASTKSELSSKSRGADESSKKTLVDVSATTTAEFVEKTSVPDKKIVKPKK